MFVKYPHLEKHGNNEVAGILEGTCYIYPKIDGTNASLWLDEEGRLKAGSRNRELEVNNDNAGFFNWAMGQDNLFELLTANPNLTLYGEWLVPHTLRTYRQDAWRKFYVFDVYDRANFKWLSKLEYADLLDKHNINYIQEIAVLESPTIEEVKKILESNTYLIEDGKGNGEGLVVKNYDFKNRYGRTTWMKIVAEAFKERHQPKKQKKGIDKSIKVEQRIVDKFLDVHAVEKELAKIENEYEAEYGFNSKDIPRLMNTVFYEMIKDHAWEMVKDFKNPTINYKVLKGLTFAKVRELKPELF